MRGCRISHLAITTFCWLPPESAPTGISRPAVLMASSPTMSSISRCSAARSMTPAFDSRSSAAKDRFSRTVIGSMRPSVLRSSGISAMPMRSSLAAEGLAMETGFPSTRICPERPRNTPKNASSSSRWPWPSRPPSPTTSPALTLSEMLSRRSTQDRLRASSTGVLAVDTEAGFGGKMWLYSRPIISSTTSLSLFDPAA